MSRSYEITESMLENRANPGERVIHLWDSVVSKVGLNNFTRRESVFLILAIIVVLLSRLPFIDAGYGIDPDAWRVANAARNLALTSQYSVSRFPGYPIQEIVLSLVWYGGARIANLLTAILSVIGFVFFALSMRKLQSQDFVLGSLAFALTPVVYINSTNSMDYVWALTFILGSFYFVISQKPVIGGIFLGLAIGCRLTSCVMLLPLSIVFIQGRRRVDLKRIFVFICLTIIVSIIVYMPVLMKYGLSFLVFYDAGYPPIDRFVKYLSIDIWGAVGLFAFALVLVCVPNVERRNTSTPKSTGKSLVIAWVVAILLYLLTFLRLPRAAGYLIPVVPFIILLLSRFLDRRLFIILCLGIIISPFINIYDVSIFTNHVRRVERNEYIEVVLVQEQNLDGLNVIVCGSDLPRIEAYLFEGMETRHVSYVSESELKSYIEQGSKRYYLAEIETYPYSNPRKISRYVYLLAEAESQYLLEQGYHVFYLPGQRGYNLEIFGVDLKILGDPLNVE